MSGPGPAVVVAVPARDEAERIGACLEALARQEPGTPPFGVVLLVNNTTDGTAAVAEAAGARLGLALRVLSVDSPDANAGWARRGAMDAAALWLEERPGRPGAILTSDADARVAPDWVARTLAAIAAGADAVAGDVTLDPADAARLSPALRARGTLEAAYHALLDEMSAALDPDPDDPWPNHSVTLGASLAVTLAAYRQVGGMPPIALGDDRAFVALLRRHDLRVRHDPLVRATTSGRLVGRAAGGIADTIAAREADPDCVCDGRLEPVPHALFRFRWRRHLRRLHAGGRLHPAGAWARHLGIAPSDAAAIAARPRAGDALEAVERISPRMPHAPLRPSELPAHIAAAHLVLAPIRRRRRAG